MIPIIAILKYPRIADHIPNQINLPFGNVDLSPGISR